MLRCWLRRSVLVPSSKKEKQGCYSSVGPGVALRVATPHFLPWPPLLACFLDHASLQALHHCWLRGAKFPHPQRGHGSSSSSPGASAGAEGSADGRGTSLISVALTELCRVWTAVCRLAIWICSCWIWLKEARPRRKFWSCSSPIAGTGAGVSEMVRARLDRSLDALAGDRGLRLDERGGLLPAASRGMARDGFLLRRTAR